MLKVLKKIIKMVDEKPEFIDIEGKEVKPSTMIDVLDIKEYNNILRQNTIESKKRNRIEFAKNIIYITGILIFLSLVFYMIYYNVLGNILYIVAKC